MDGACREGRVDAVSFASREIQNIATTAARVPEAYLEPAQQYLRPGLTLATLKRIGELRSATQAACLMHEAKCRCLNLCAKPA